MKFLFFDTETSGLPKSFNACPIKTPDNWPRLIQIAWEITDETGDLTATFHTLVKPDGFKIPSEATAIHGITTEDALANGIDIKQVLRMFSKVLNEADYLIAHNISFDINVILAECKRYGVGIDFNKVKKICTCKDNNVIKHCNIYLNGRLKAPKLGELHLKLFNSEMELAHRADADVAYTVKCFWELVWMGIIKID